MHVHDAYEVVRFKDSSKMFPSTSRQQHIPSYLMQRNIHDGKWLLKFLIISVLGSSEVELVLSACTPFTSLFGLQSGPLRKIHSLHSLAPDYHRQE